MPTLLIVISLAIVLLLLLIFASKHKEYRKFNPHTPFGRPKSRPIYKDRITSDYEIKAIPLAEPNSEPVWAILDLQTTGLSTTIGQEDLIIEATWLILDKDFRLVKRNTQRVLQETAGSLEAKQVHGITEQDLKSLGITEVQLIQSLREDITDQIILVMHNAAFDLSILRGTVARISPEWLPKLQSINTLCTMNYRLGQGHSEEKYPSLIALSAELGRISPQTFHSLRPVSWRNCYFTRLCLRELVTQYPELLSEHLLSAESYLSNS